MCILTQALGSFSPLSNDPVLLGRPPLTSDHHPHIHSHSAPWDLSLECLGLGGTLKMQSTVLAQKCRPNALSALETVLKTPSVYLTYMERHEYAHHRHETAEVQRCKVTSPEGHSF